MIRGKFNKEKHQKHRRKLPIAVRQHGSALLVSYDYEPAIRNFVYIVQ